MTKASVQSLVRIVVVILLLELCQAKGVQSQFTQVKSKCLYNSKEGFLLYEVDNGLEKAEAQSI